MQREEQSDLAGIQGTFGRNYPKTDMVGGRGNGQLPGDEEHERGGCVSRARRDAWRVTRVGQGMREGGTGRGSNTREYFTGPLT